MTRLLYMTSFLLFMSLLFLTSSYASPLPSPDPGRPYAQADLAPLFVRQAGSTAPHGKADFYMATYDLSETNVALQVENMSPGAYIFASILSGDCQGDFVAQLNPLTINQAGNAQSRTHLTNLRIPNQQWYVKLEFCDMLNPGQICFPCGRIDYLNMTAAGSLPETGSPIPMPLPTIDLLLLVCLSLITIGAYIRQLQKK